MTSSSERHFTEGDRLYLQVGKYRSYAKFEEGRSEEDKISSVHYIRFQISTEMESALSDESIPVSFHIAQGDYKHDSVITANTRFSLLNDLSIDQNVYAND